MAARRTTARKTAKKTALARKLVFPKMPDDGAGVQRSPLMPRMSQDQLADMMRAAMPPPGVIPKEHEAKHKIAMDAAFGSLSTWVAGAQYNWAFVEGYTFMGYPYLAQLANIAEYRLIGDTIATEATRKWIEIKSHSDKAKAKADKIKELKEELDRLGAERAFKTVSEQDSWYGRAHLYLDTGDTNNRPELMTPIGDGKNFTKKKFNKGFLRALKTVEPVWCYPAQYDAQDPLADNWYRPNTWFVNGKEVHTSRLLLFVGRPVSDLLKPAFSFGGLSLSQMAKPYIDNWLQTRQSVNDLVQAFSVMVLATDLAGMMQVGNEELNKRADLFNRMRNNKNLMMIAKNEEDFKNVSAPIAGLDKLQAQAQEHICSPAQLPLVKYTGITPSGLNASSDNELRVFYDRQHAYQEYFFDPHFGTVFRLAQINIWGEVDEDLYYIWEPLFELSEMDKAEVRKTEAETDKTLVDGSILAQEEARKRISDDPEQPYGEIDPDEVPEQQLPELGNVHEREEAEAPPAEAGASA